jgi:hypothetical protein
MLTLRPSNKKEALLELNGGLNVLESVVIAQSRLACFLDAGLPVLRRRVG